jgi:type I restriction enzyme, S subunit
MSTLYPKIWDKVELELLFQHVIGGDWGKALDYADPDFLEVNCIRGSEFKNWKENKGSTASIRKIKKSSLKSRKLQIDDILIEISGGGPEQPVGRIVLIDQHVFSSTDESYVCTNFLRLIRLHQFIDSTYVSSYLKSFYLSGEVINYQGGSNNLRNLKFKDYSKIDIPLPSQAEQKQIGTKLDKLLAQVDKIKARLDAVPNILKYFRQSVLASAVSGKLTEDFRESNPFGKNICIGDIAEEIKYGTSKKCNYDSGNTPVLRIPNISKGDVSHDDMKFADFDEKELQKLKLEQGDLLVIRSNGSADLIGKVAIIRTEDVHCLFAGYLIRIRIDKKVALADYILRCFQSPQLRKVIEIQARSTSGVHNINSKELAALEITLPELEEQKEIVKRVENLFTFADKIEKSLEKAQAKVNNLTQSILAKAFRGELTEQWRKQNPDLISGENSAQALLEKIKVEREKLIPKKKAHKKQSQRKKSG